MNEISKETFEKMDVDSKLNVMFDLQTNIQPHCRMQAAACGDRFDVIEKGIRKWGLAHLFIIPPFSFIGGFAAMWAKFKLGGN